MPNLFGIHSVREALRKSADSLEMVYFSQDLSNPRLRELFGEVRRNKLTVRRIPEEALRRMAGSINHQGVVVTTAEFAYCPTEDILAAVAHPGLLLVLDEIQDPQNLGAILRSAEGAGVGGVFLPKHHSAGISAATVRASAGAAVHLKIARETNLTQLLERLKDAGFWVVGLDLGAEKLWTEGDYGRPTAIVLGNEGRGIRPLVRRHCDDLVRIPMMGQVESLNVSAATAILMYEVLRQRLEEKDSTSAERS